MPRKPCHKYQTKTAEPSECLCGQVGCSNLLELEFFFSSNQNFSINNKETKTPNNFPPLAKNPCSTAAVLVPFFAPKWLQGTVLSVCHTNLRSAVFAAFAQESDLPSAV